VSDDEEICASIVCDQERCGDRLLIVVETEHAAPSQAHVQDILRSVAARLGWRMCMLDGKTYCPSHTESNNLVCAHCGARSCVCLGESRIGGRRL
jgi:hypothetical protein